MHHTPHASHHGTHRQTGRENTLGLVGFIVSLVGLLSCGLFGPVGLVLSLAALGRPARGFATAGVIVGLLASAWLAVVVLLGALAGVGALAGLVP